jgi:hypothetical protein
MRSLSTTTNGDTHMAEKFIVTAKQNGRFIDVGGAYIDPSLVLTRLEATQLRDQLTGALQRSEPLT